MDTFLIAFSLDCTNDLEERYKRFIAVLKSLGVHYLEFTKTCWFLRTKSGKNTVRDRLLKEMKSTGSDGRLIVVDVGLVGWALHVHGDEDKAMGDWIMKYVSGEE